MNKKINIYYAGFKHRVGGAFFHVVNIEKGLKELGYDVNIITLDSLPLILRFIPPLIQKISDKVFFPNGVLYRQKITKFFYKFFYKNSADIDIFEDVYTYWQSKNKSIVILHALWSDNLQAFDFGNEQRVSLEKKELKIINEINTKIITVSYPYRNFIVSRLYPLGLEKEIGVVELGVNLDKFGTNNNIQNKSIVFVGSLEERKNVKFLIDVFAGLQKMGDYKLFIVGDGPQKNELTHLVINKNIKNVTFLGRLSYDAVMIELTKHQYYLHTSTKESFSYSLLEAKLSGLTTIAFSGLEVPPEFIDISVDKFDVEEWVSKIISFDSNENKFNHNKFSYKLMTNRTLEEII